MSVQIIKDFVGGVDLTTSGHIQSVANQLTKRSAGKLSIIKTTPPQTVVLSLGQCLGKCAVPIVSVGDRVLVGQLIACAQSDFCVPVRASISGKVAAIDNQPSNHPSGLEELSITIESDGLYEWAPSQGCGKDFAICAPQKIIDHIRDCGIVGLGGAGFPTHIKLGKLDTCHHIIINGIECEPGVSCDNALMQNQPHELLQGVAILLHLCQAKTAIIALEAHSKHTLAILKKANNNPDISFAIMPNRYAAGDEKILIKSILNKTVPQGKRSVDIGILCQNVSTTHAIYDAVVNNKPLVSRVVSVGGAGLDMPMVQNYQVPIGISLLDLLNNLPTKVKQNTALDYHVGGLMMGRKIKNLTRTIDKTSSSLFVNLSPEPKPQQACIRCGQCHEACPIGLLPQQLYWHAKSDEIDKAVDNYLLSCTGCNCCTVICPSHIPLGEYFNYAKALYHKQETQKQQSDIARERFEFREFRLERNAVERKTMLAEKKVAIQKKMAADKAQKDKIQAALARVEAKKTNQDNQDDN